MTDEELLKRLSGLYSEGFVAEVARELAAAREPEVVDKEQAVAAVHHRFTYRMNDLGQFMKALLQRFTSGSTARMTGPGRCGRTVTAAKTRDPKAIRGAVAYVPMRGPEAERRQECAEGEGFRAE